MQILRWCIYGEPFKWASDRRKRVPFDCISLRCFDHIASLVFFLLKSWCIYYENSILSSKKGSMERMKRKKPNWKLGNHIKLSTIQQENHFQSPEKIRLRQRMPGKESRHFKRFFCPFEFPPSENLSVLIEFQAKAFCYRRGSCSGI